jgi:hypothetical protein
MFKCNIIRYTVSSIAGGSTLLSFTFGLVLRSCWMLLNDQVFGRTIKIVTVSFNYAIISPSPELLLPLESVKLNIFLFISPLTPPPPPDTSLVTVFQ